MIVPFLKCKLSALLYAGFLTVMPSSCGNDTDYKPIDFRPRIEIAAPDENASGRKPLKAAVASMVSPKESFAFYRKIIRYIGGKLNRDIELIQRRTYGEINEMLLKGDIDFALICTGPYVAGREKFGFEAVAAPVLRGRPFYQAYLIVHKDSDYQSLPDLHGKVFAFTDPQSNTGAMVPRYWLSLDGFRPEDFFRSYTYTYSHDNSILAVARKMADGATVFGHIWDYYQVTEDQTAWEILDRLAAYLSEAVTETGASRYECHQEFPEVVYYTAAVAAALSRATIIGLGDYRELADRAFRRVLSQQKSNGVFPYSLRNYSVLSDQRSYPRYLSMLLTHLLLELQHHQQGTVVTQ